MAYHPGMDAFRRQGRQRAERRCRCGHPRAAHERYRKGTECALCGPAVCPRYRRDAGPGRGSHRRGEVRHWAAADLRRPPEQVAQTDQAPGGRAQPVGGRAGEGVLDGVQVAVQHLAQVGDLRLDPRVHVIGQGPVGVAGRGRAGRPRGPAMTGSA
jgi:hypothetical protein